MTKILKAFYTKSQAVNGFRGGFWYLIIDRKPGFCYSKRLVESYEQNSWERDRSQFLYYSQRFPFVSSYIHSPGTKDAFGGREIHLSMRNGEKKVFKGDLWDSGQRMINPNLVDVGAATEKQLKKCYVYFSNHIDKDYFIKWLDENPDKVFEYKDNQF